MLIYRFRCFHEMIIALDELFCQHRVLSYEKVKLLVYPIANTARGPAPVCRARDRRCIAADFHHLGSHIPSGWVGMSTFQSRV